MQRKRECIVLIDDDRDFLEMNRRLLEEKGYSVSCFDDSDEAMRAMHCIKPDLVVTDLMMAGLDSGFKLSQKIKQDPMLGDVPVIIVTAASSLQGFSFNPHSQGEFESLNADAYFDKPVSTHIFLKRVRELIDKKGEAGRER
ncbi:MAG: response regulator [Spirochaetes bacterium]|nr:response regulator [Spirochaetota bacterium]